MTKSKLLFLSALILFLLVGCSKEREANIEEISNSRSKENLKFEKPKSPQLKIAVKEEEFTADLDSYAWSYFDQEENGMVGIETDTNDVSKLIGHRKGPGLGAYTAIELKFEEEPIS